MIFGDKTGPHLYHVPTLLEWFPNAKVVHTFRDPRAVLASEHKKLLRKPGRLIDEAEKASKYVTAFRLRLSRAILSWIVILYITVAWSYAAILHFRYKKRYPRNYYLSRFEDLVSKPEESVIHLCQFLEIDFHPSMLEPPKIDSSYTKIGGSGFDTQTLNRWQTYLKPWMNTWLLIWCRRYLRDFGYIQ
jgi:hypothetical protein